MDPTASFLITARDRTAAGIESANRGLKSLVGTVRSARTLFAGFGVAVGGMAFANWITGAIKANDLTEEQTAKVKEAKQALEEYHQASRDLAVSFAQELTPAIQAASAVMIGWNRILFNADPFPFEQQIENARDALRRLQNQGLHGLAIYTPEQKAQMAALEHDIEELLQKQRDAMEQSGRTLLFKIADKETQKSISDFFAKHGKLAEAKTPEIELEIVPKLIPDDLRKAVTDAQKAMADFFATNADVGEIKMPQIELEPIVDTKPIEDDFRELGATLNHGLKDSLVDFLVDGELRFKDFIKRLAAEWLVSDVFKGLSTAFGGGGGFLAGLFGGGRAEGGPVSAGRTYLVGERGPEFFSPGMSGQIVPAGAGGMTVHLGDTHIDARGASVDLVQRLPAILDARDRSLIAKVRDLKNRNRF